MSLLIKSYLSLLGQSKVQQTETAIVKLLLKRWPQASVFRWSQIHAKQCISEALEKSAFSFTWQKFRSKHSSVAALTKNWWSLGRWAYLPVSFSLNLSHRLHLLHYYCLQPLPCNKTWNRHANISCLSFHKTGATHQAYCHSIEQMKDQWMEECRNEMKVNLCKLINLPFWSSRMLTSYKFMPDINWSS